MVASQIVILGLSFGWGTSYPDISYHPIKIKLFHDRIPAKHGDKFNLKLIPD